MKIFLLAFILLTSGCALWEDMTTPRTGRTDRVDVLLGVRLMPYAELEELCGERVNLRSCGTDTWVFMTGEPAEYTRLFAVQFLSWTDIAKKCGWNTAACFEGNALFTAEYDIGNSYRMGVIGDLLADNLDMNLTFNAREHMGRQLMLSLNGSPGRGFRW